MLQLLADHPYIIMDEHFEGNEDRTEEPEAGEDVKVWGNVVAFVERLDDEHFKSLQVCIWSVWDGLEGSYIMGRAKVETRGVAAVRVPPTEGGEHGNGLWGAGRQAL